MFKLGYGAGIKFVRKYGWAFLILGNIVIAIMIAMMYSRYQEAHPAFVKQPASSSPSPPNSTLGRLS